MTARTARLTAVITGKAREVSAERAHEQNVLAITGRIHRKERRLSSINAEARRLRRELRADRRELRAVLQRNASIDADHPAYGAAGAADAIDGAENARERGK